MPPSSMNGLPGADAMTDSLEFVRNMWGSMKIPGMAMPSLSPEEINKQITDLKAVESWLQLNMNMLRSSIQALEVQSATMTALQSMSQSFAQATSPKAEASDKPIFESPFAAFTATPEKPAEAPAADSASALPDPAALASQFANPTAWWNVVQEQFSQAVNKAVTPPEKKKARKTVAAKKTTSTTARKKAAPAAAARKKKSAF
jgi:hypothetical protein